MDSRAKVKCKRVARDLSIRDKIKKKKHTREHGGTQAPSRIYPDPAHPCDVWPLEKVWPNLVFSFFFTCERSAGWTEEHLLKTAAIFLSAASRKRNLRGEKQTTWLVSVVTFSRFRLPRAHFIGARSGTLGEKLEGDPIYLTIASRGSVPPSTATEFQKRCSVCFHFGVSPNGLYLWRPILTEPFKLSA